MRIPARADYAVRAVPELAVRQGNGPVKAEEITAAPALRTAPAAEAAQRPAPPTAVPGGAPLNGLLGSLEVGHPVTSLHTLLPTRLQGQ
ncbi:hypothetical protein ACGFZB_18500 [Streptomyces cinerochromogenes]|uniref:Uncharacterized protein n=1 Tax=Streptomyces cinerochromogenes TaxID=66422 RepID=A0ABW7B5F7_9ACTN